MKKCKLCGCEILPYCLNCEGQVAGLVTEVAAEQEAAMRRLARDYAQAVQDLGRMRSAAIREAAENL